MYKQVSFHANFFTQDPSKTNKELDFPMYTFCYDHEKEETIYTEHLIFSPTLLEDSELEFERKKKFSMMTYEFERFSLDFITLKDAFDKVQKYAKKTNKIQISLYYILFIKLICYVFRLQ